MAKKVFIGVGHGGSDAGACANGLKEKDVNLGIALACRDFLTQNGVQVAISRTKDETDPTSSEVKECNAFKPDYAVEIHNNAGGGTGAEVYHYSKGGTSKTLSQNILNEIVAIGQKSRGLKTKLGSNGKDYFAWIRDTSAPAALVECAFLDSANHTMVNTAAKQKTMGVAIAKGVLKTCGITPKVQTTPAPANTQPTVTKPTTTEVKKVYRVRKSKDDASSQIGAYSELNHAIFACDKAPIGFKVFDWNGNMVYEPKPPVVQKPVEQPKPVQPVVETPKPVVTPPVVEKTVETPKTVENTPTDTKTETKVDTKPIVAPVQEEAEKVDSIVGIVIKVVKKIIEIIFKGSNKGE